jgi:hypothetical protein
MNPLDKNTRSLATFESVAEVCKWLSHHGCLTEGAESHVQQLWDARHYRLSRPELGGHEINYLFRIHIKPTGRRFFKVERVVYELKDGEMVRRRKG